MTLHISTIIPEHIVIVSDRLLDTPPNHYVELQNDRYKHFVLICDDAKAAISFTGFAGIALKNGDLKEDTIEWLRDILMETAKKSHSINDHISDISRQAQNHIAAIQKKYRLDLEQLKLAIQITGWCHEGPFNCIIENYQNKHCLAGKTRDKFKVWLKTYYEKAAFHGGPQVMIQGQRELAEKQKDLLAGLKMLAFLGGPKAIFDASVEVIRAVANISKGTVGYNCSGLRLSRNDQGIEVYDEREGTIWDTVMPDMVYSTSRYTGFVANVKGKKTKPKEKVKLKSLVLPDIAQTDIEKLSFWFRVIEKLRLLHNDYGAKVKKTNSKKILKRFHNWQEDIFHPLQAAVFEQINMLKQKLIEDEPEKYKVNGTVDSNPFVGLKEQERNNTTWDQYIDLSDLEEFKTYI